MKKYNNLLPVKIIQTLRDSRVVYTMIVCFNFNAIFLFQSNGIHIVKHNIDLFIFKALDSNDTVF